MSILSVSSLCVAVIVAVPSLFAVISPSSETEITDSSEVVHTMVLSVVFSGENSHSKV